MNFNFTDQARRALANARKEAIRLSHDYVGTEHLLLGVITEPGGTGAAVLVELSADPDVIRQQLELALPRGRSAIALGELPYTSRAKKSLEYALAEARKLGHSYCGSGHLLLGLLREEKGIAAEVLNGVGVTLESARRQTLIHLDKSSGATESVSHDGDYDEVIVLHLTNGEAYRVAEKRGSSAREFVEVIARRGAWITGRGTSFVPVTAITRIQIYSPEEWKASGLDEVL